MKLPPDSDSTAGLIHRYNYPSGLLASEAIQQEENDTVLEI